MHPLRFVLVGACACALLAYAFAERIVVDLSGPGWHLWRDTDAEWRDDTLHFPAPPLEQLPVNPPTGGWEGAIVRDALPVAVPGTVEQYLQTVPGPDGDLTGVSWWTRSLEIPAASGPRRVLLRFEAVRERAEVFVDRRLVAYDIVGSTPFEADITALVRPGERCELAVRVTDPGGNFDWRDSRPMPWGQHQLPLSHGFGGVTGGVQLVVCDPVYLDDLHVQNTPSPTEANVHATVRNTSGTAVRRDVEVRVTERAAPGREVFRTVLREVALPPGESVVTAKISAPQARLWNLDDPALHVCTVTVRDRDAAADAAQRTFGFRWFAPDGIGRDAVLRLNGKRIVLRTAISWGFWPLNGIFPTPELAEKQVRIAKAYGLNMLNFHRAIGQPVVLDRADELGLLYYEEPGAYKSVDDALALGRAIAREKLMRMVRRDRSHPSLVIYNLINEWDSRNPNPDPEEIARHRADMAAAHALDPSRTITHTSAWARGPEIDDPAKLHFRPFDATPYLSGWYDHHHAGGPAVWNESLYRSPADYFLRTDNVREIVFWGEEGAISTPPRLGFIRDTLAAAPHLGWDGAGYLEWHRATEAFLDAKGLRGTFRDADAFTGALGAVSLRHQGRRIENVRLGNVGDGYAINGWEAELIENHSGVVDVFRNPKGDPAILAYYNQPCYVAVKSRHTVLQPPGVLVVDCFAINEVDLRGPHRLRLVARDASGRELAVAHADAVLSGGDVYGQLLAEGLSLAIPPDARGALRLEAVLTDAVGAERARGHDEAYAVDWRSDAIRGAGAVWEDDGEVRAFLVGAKQHATPEYADALGRLDWIVAARGPLEGEPQPISAAQLRAPDGSGNGVTVEYFGDRALAECLLRRAEPTVRLAVADGAAPDPTLPMIGNYSVRWTGTVVPPRAGKYAFVVRTTGAVRLDVAGRRLAAST
ncbi:MAG TPA: PA14 domain-containing protein, partial [Opitutaceae bacterium]|nr:PA14 domain-containing protein [Opitutaceae bacterium]